LLRDNLIHNATFGEKVDNVAPIHDWFLGKNESLKDIELGLNNKWSIVKKIYRQKNLDKS